MSTKDVRALTAIPILPMEDEEATLTFYVSFLGFAMDWKHRFRVDSPLYAQVRLGGAVLHLDGHAPNEAAPVEARI